MSVLRPVSMPRLAPIASEVDVAIVGAGAAGIGAARRCLAEGLTCAVVEARDRVGGRCVTVPFGGQPIDLGAHWLHAGSMNPLVALGRQRGEPLAEARYGSRLVVDGAIADEATVSDHSAAFARATDAIVAAKRQDADVSIAEVLPDLGRWRVPVAMSLTLISGRPLDEVSAQDFPSEEFGENWLVDGGYGAYLARLAENLPIALGRPVDSIDWSGKGVDIDGDGARLRAKAAIVTVPVAVLASDTIRFTPGLPDRLLEAISAFLPGTYEHILLDWPDSPFLDVDRFAKIVAPEASFGLASRLEGSALHYLEIDHVTAEAHRRDGRALATFARDWLAAQLGADAVRRLAVRHVTNWIGEPFSREGWAVARPGRAGDRAILSEPIDERIWIVGEATSLRLWGTVGGAWEEGDAAAAAVARRLHGQPSGLPVQKSA